MRIAVLGTGDVGRTLGNAFLTLGHEVMMGSRSATNEKAQAWAKNGGASASAGTFADAAKFGEMIVLATLGMANDEALDAAGAENLAGKVVIDTTNPLDFSGGGPKLAIAGNDSGGERVQKRVPGALVVKAFNTVGHLAMFRPDFPDGKPDMFIAGNDAGAKKAVTDLLLNDFGWGAVHDLGGIESSRYLEPMCLAWVLAAIPGNHWYQAFKLLRK